MPCYCPQEPPKPKVVHASGISREELRAIQKYSAKMEAVVCALLNELSRRGIAEDVIAEASRSGLIDIMGLWDIHKNNDVSRLALDLHTRYSKDEQEILKRLLSD